VDDYVDAEIRPWVPNAWVDHTKTKIGYEIPVTRHFFRYTAHRPVAEIDATLRSLEARVQELLSLRSMSHGGVDGNVSHGRPRRPSTCAWLRDVPAHWRECKLSLVADLGTGHTPSRAHPEWWTNCTIPWVTTGEVAQMRSDRIEYITETREMISHAGIENSSAVVHPAGTVVLCRTASLGYSAIMGADMATSQDFATWTCGPQLDPRYLLLCLRAMRTDLLERLATGSTHKTIYMPDIESIRVPVPPMEEQAEIVSAVWERLNRMDELTDTLSQQMALLRERRQPLIAAAVTGETAIP
jgi:type I restriction enzyme S subunit